MADSAITLDATIGGASANSFLTLAEAEAIIHARPFHSAWDSITEDDQKKAAIVAATKKLSAYNWKGYIASQEQALPFPRGELYDYDQRQYPIDEYPIWLKDATAELAFIMATEDTQSTSSADGYSEIKVASIAVKIDKTTTPQTFESNVYDDIRRWINQGSANNSPVLRV